MLLYHVSNLTVDFSISKRSLERFVKGWRETVLLLLLMKMKRFEIQEFGYGFSYCVLSECRFALIKKKSVYRLSLESYTHTQRLASLDLCR